MAREKSRTAFDHAKAVRRPLDLTIGVVTDQRLGTGEDGICGGDFLQTQPAASWALTEVNVARPGHRGSCQPARLMEEAMSKPEDRETGGRGGEHRPSFLGALARVVAAPQRTRDDGPEEHARVARDLGMNGRELRDLAARGPDAVDEKGVCKKDLAARPNDDAWEGYRPNAVALTGAKIIKGHFPE